MLILESIAKIRRAFFVQGKSIKLICRELRVSRKVVRKVIRSEATEFRYEREAQPLPKIGPWTDQLDELLLANEGKAARERLSPSALKAFFNVVDRWSVRDEDARQLLGGVTNGPYYEMKKNPKGRVLDADKLLRISYLIGIFKALSILHGQPLADEWVRLPNTNRIFVGSTPLAYMMKGGAPAMQTVRRLLDARRGGM